MTRKDFITLTFTLIGSAAVASRCSNDNTTPTVTGVGGSTAQSGGHGGISGHGGVGGTTGQAGTGGQAQSDAGTTTCADPLAASQVADPTGHTHTVTVPASTLNATTVQTFTTSVAGPPNYPDHTHTVALTATELATIKGGGSVTVMSGPAAGHTHMFMVSCH